MAYLQRYENTDGHKLILHHTRTEFEEKYKINIPMVIKYTMLKFYQTMELFMKMSLRYNSSEHGSTIERNHVDHGDQIIIHAQQLIDFRTSETQSIITIWEVEIINNKYLENMFCGLVCGIIEYRKEDECKELDLEWTNRNFIAINENGERWSVMTGEGAVTNKNPSLNKYYFEKLHYKIKNNDIIKIMLSNRKINFYVNNNYKFKADIQDQHDYKMFLSFKYKTGQARIKSFKQFKIN